MTSDASPVTWFRGTAAYGGQNLTRAADRMNTQQMKWRILNGGHNMPAFAGILKPEETNDLLSFLQTRSISPETFAGRPHN